MLHCLHHGPHRTTRRFIQIAPLCHGVHDRTATNPHHTTAPYHSRSPPSRISPYHTAHRTLLTLSHTRSRSLPLSLVVFTALPNPALLLLFLGDRCVLVVIVVVVVVVVIAVVVAARTFGVTGIGWTVRLWSSPWLPLRCLKCTCSGRSERCDRCASSFGRRRSRCV